MACKIAPSSQSAARMTWGTVDPFRASKPGGTSQDSTRAGDVDLAQRLAEIEQLRHADIAQARRSGFEEGFRKAKDEAAAEIRASGERLAQNLKELGLLKKRIRNEAEMEVVRLSLAIARRILHRELTIDPESIQGVVHAALRTLENRDVLRVRVSPEAAGMMRSILEQAAVGRGIEVNPDPRMGAGEIIFETAVGELDASIDTQLQEIQRGFADRLGAG